MWPSFDAGEQSGRELFAIVGVKGPNKVEMINKLSKRQVGAGVVYLQSFAIRIRIKFSCVCVKEKEKDR